MRHSIEWRAFYRTRKYGALSIERVSYGVLSIERALELCTCAGVVPQTAIKEQCETSDTCVGRLLVRIRHELRRVYTTSLGI